MLFRYWMTLLIRTTNLLLFAGGLQVTDNLRHCLIATWHVFVAFVRSPVPQVRDKNDDYG